MFPVDLISPRLRLREFTVADAEAYLSLITHPEVVDNILDEERATMDMVVTLLTERHRAAQETNSQGV